MEDLFENIISIIFKLSYIGIPIGILISIWGDAEFGFKVCVSSGIILFFTSWLV